jgi:hypothetical protein
MCLESSAGPIARGIQCVICIQLIVSLLDYEYSSTRVVSILSIYSRSMDTVCVVCTLRVVDHMCIHNILARYSTRVVYY